jgi:lysophospholipase L1-like esterase
MSRFKPALSINDYSLDKRKFNFPVVIGIASKNLFDKTDVTLNYYINKDTGNLAFFNGYYASNFIPVNSNTVYSCRVTGQNYAWYDVNKSYISGGTTNAGMTSPANAKFIRISVPGNQIDNAQLELGGTITGYDSFKPIVGAEALRKKWYNKKYNAMGDSVTAMTGNYVAGVGSALGVAVANNYGINGSTIAQVDAGDSSNAMCLRFNSMEADANLITVFGGTNDFGGSIPLGSVSDGTGLQSFNGALKILIEGILTRSPNARLVFITPMQRNTGIGLGPNVAGLYVVDYVNAIKAVCGSYGIPVLDLYSNSGISTFNLNTYTSDGLHPNSTGFSRLRNIITSFLDAQ